MLNKNKTMQAFSKAARDYDRYAVWQKKTAEQLTKFVTVRPGSVLDIGCGTGEVLFQLKKIYPENEMHGIDLSAGMIEQAQKRSIKEHSPDITFKVCDMEKIDYPNESFDLVVSNLSLHWLNNLDHCFSEVARILKPAGMFIFCSAGQGSLAELKKAYIKSFGRFPQAHYFHSAKEVKTALVSANLKNIRMQTKSDVLFFNNFRNLAYSMKNIGAKAQGSPILSRTDIVKLEKNYIKTPRGLPLTYNLIFTQATS